MCIWLVCYRNLEVSSRIGICLVWHPDLTTQIQNLLSYLHFSDQPYLHQILIFLSFPYFRFHANLSHNDSHTDLNTEMQFCFKIMPLVIAPTSLFLVSSDDDYNNDNNNTCSLSFFNSKPLKIFLSWESNMMENLNPHLSSSLIAASNDILFLIMWNFLCG